MYSTRGMRLANCHARRRRLVSRLKCQAAQVIRTLLLLRATGIQRNPLPQEINSNPTLTIDGGHHHGRSTELGRARAPRARTRPRPRTQRRAHTSGGGGGRVWCSSYGNSALKRQTNGREWQMWRFQIQPQMVVTAVT